MTDELGASIPFFGARKVAQRLQMELAETTGERDRLRQELERLGALPILEREAIKLRLEGEVADLSARLAKDYQNHVDRIDAERAASTAALAEAKVQLEAVRKTVIQTEDLAALQEAGVYKYRHPLSDAVKYEQELALLETEIKEMTRKDGGAVLATSQWSVNGSEAQGKAMVRDFSKLMLRAFNAEADNLVRGLKPFKVASAIERLEKVSGTIEKLGKTMSIRISTPYLQLRVRELELTADFLQKEAEEKEAERLERERLREERKVEAEIERERAKLEKEKQHYTNALAALVEKGDTEGAARIETQMADVNRALADVDYRAANIRAGYVYVISNIGSFGEEMVKVGMTRRLDPMDRIRELSDASVPFNFDVHALFFSKDAVGIETAMHEKLSERRVNIVNQRREFFRATAAETKVHLAELAGELLQFQDTPEALEYRQGLARLKSAGSAAIQNA